MTKEERERIKAERRAAREAGKSVKTEQGATAGEAPAADEAPKKMTKEERERIKAERRAAREAGQSLKKPADGGQAEEQREEAGEG
jgi:predicted N-acyltransferase